MGLVSTPVYDLGGSDDPVSRNKCGKARDDQLSRRHNRGTDLTFGVDACLFSNFMQDIRVNFYVYESPLSIFYIYTLNPDHSLLSLVTQDSFCPCRVEGFSPTGSVTNTYIYI